MEGVTCKCCALGYGGLERGRVEEERMREERLRQRTLPETPNRKDKRQRKRMRSDKAMRPRGKGNKIHVSGGSGQPAMEATV